MAKRGTDHSWKLVKYKGDVGIYARCKCKFHYICLNPMNNNEDYKFYSYCPICGARKKWYSKDIRKIDKYSFED